MSSVSMDRTTEMSHAAQQTLLFAETAPRRCAPAMCSANTLRAISLWQPWASAMASGAKQIETRSWPTWYRGELVICAAKRKPTLAECGDADTLKAAMSLPYGAALCVVWLYDCRGVEWVTQNMKLSEAERDLGDYTPGIGRYGWLTRNCRKLRKPVPIIGRQGLWKLDLETTMLIGANLPNAPDQRPEKQL
jgi:hypothetical protein